MFSLLISFNPAGTASILFYNGFRLAEGGDFYHKTSCETQKFKISKKSHKGHWVVYFANWISTKEGYIQIYSEDTELATIQVQNSIGSI